MASESSDGLVEHLANGKGGREKREGGEEYRSEEVTLDCVDRSSYSNEVEKARRSLPSRERVYEERAVSRTIAFSCSCGLLSCSGTFM